MSRYRTPVKRYLELIRDIHRYRVISGKNSGYPPLPNWHICCLSPYTRQKTHSRTKQQKRKKHELPRTSQKKVVGTRPSYHPPEAVLPCNRKDLCRLDQEIHPVPQQKTPDDHGYPRDRTIPDTPCGAKKCRCLNPKPHIQALIPIQKAPHLNFWGDTVSLNIITATTHSKKIRDASLRDLLTHASATKEFALIKRGKTFVVDPSLLKDLERDEITTQISPSEFT